MEGDKIKRGFDYWRLATALERQDRFEQDRGWLSYENYDSEEERIEEMERMSDLLVEEAEELYEEFHRPGVETEEERDIGYEIVDVFIFTRGVAHCLETSVTRYMEEDLGLEEEYLPPGQKFDYTQMADLFARHDALSGGMQTGVDRESRMSSSASEIYAAAERLEWEVDRIEELGEYSEELDEDIGRRVVNLLWEIKRAASSLGRDFSEYFEEKQLWNVERFDEEEFDGYGDFFRKKRGE